MGEEEKEALNRIFDHNRGILFAHGFDKVRIAYEVRSFEREFAAKMNVPYAQAVSSGTAALKCALKGLDIGPGDEVITQAFTFVATVEAIVDCGATPIIVDIDRTYNLDPIALEAAITKKTRAIIVVHMAGAAAQLDQILAIAREHNIPVIEDTAQACGGTYQGKMLGTLGEAGCYSFDFGKVITSGEGGMVVTANANLFERTRAYHDHGHDYKNPQARGIEGALLGGFNYRMSELQAAVGREQLKKLDFILTEQRKNKTILKSRLASEQDSLEIQFRKICDEAGDIADCLIFTVGDKARALAVAAHLGKEGVGTKNLPDAMRWHFAGWWEHLFVSHPQYSNENISALWKKSRELLEQSIAIPIMVKDDEASLEKKSRAIKSALKTAGALA